ncbi:MAG: hypothetical protein FIA94_03550 [Nitrospirae bacterium]|nr:hypothetical protein [Nitrospirota bacterium]
MEFKTATARKSFIRCRSDSRGTVAGNFTDTADELHIITGHGGFSGHYAGSSRQDAAAGGNPTNDEVCDDCHGLPLSYSSAPLNPGLSFRKKTGSLTTPLRVKDQKA